MDCKKGYKPWWTNEKRDQKPKETNGTKDKHEIDQVKDNDKPRIESTEVEIERVERADKKEKKIILQCRDDMMKKMIKHFDDKENLDC